MPTEPEPPFSECTIAVDDLPIRQGDVIEALNDEAGFRLGIVVTADCDIAQLKHNNTLSCVPLFTLSDFLATFYIPRRLEKGLMLLRQDVTRRATAIKQGIHPASAAFSEEAMDVWLKDSDGETIAASLQAPADRRRVEFTRAADLYRTARAAAASGELAQGIAALAAIRVHGGSPVDKATPKVWEDINTYVKSLPGDAFFVGSIGQPMAERSGFVAYLRVLRELHPAHVALRPADLATARVKRIARLRSPYVYRLTQQLASVFSSIGLPNSYEDERDRLTTLLANPDPQ